MISCPLKPCKGLSSGNILHLPAPLSFCRGRASWGVLGGRGPAGSGTLGLQAFRAEKHHMQVGQCPLWVHWGFWGLRRSSIFSLHWAARVKQSVGAAPVLTVCVHSLGQSWPQPCNAGWRSQMRNLGLRISKFLARGHLAYKWQCQAWV